LIFLSTSLIFNFHKYQITRILKNENYSIEKELENKYLKNPNIKELGEFLRRDYIYGEYRTGKEKEKIPNQLRKSAIAENYNMCIVLIDTEVIFQINDYKSQPHLITTILNGIMLNNGTFVYIEPYTNLIIVNSHSQIEDFLKNLIESYARSQPSQYVYTMSASIKVIKEFQIY